MSEFEKLLHQYNCGHEIEGYGMFYPFRHIGNLTVFVEFLLNERESLKAITELAVKGLQRIKEMEFVEGAATPEMRIAIRSLNEIKRLQNGTT